jgi:hypothetical protein
VPLPTISVIELPHFLTIESKTSTSKFPNLMSFRNFVLQMILAATYLVRHEVSAKQPRQITSALVVDVRTSQRAYKLNYNWYSKRQALRTLCRKLRLAKYGNTHSLNLSTKNILSLLSLVQRKLAPTSSRVEMAIQGSLHFFSIETISIISANSRLTIAFIGSVQLVKCEP